MSINQYTKLPPKLSMEDLELAARDSILDMSNPGFCMSCGAAHDGCEPDAEHYKCEECGKNAVFGAELIFLVFAER